MATVTIRNLSEETRLALKARAAGNNRSMEAEVRDIVESAVRAEVDFISDWLVAAAGLRGDFELPSRSTGRAVELS